MKAPCAWGPARFTPPFSGCSPPNWCARRARIKIPPTARKRRRRYYELTARGRRLLKEEVAHLGRLLAYARGKQETA